MNAVPRPTQVTGEFVAEVRWPDLLGGGTETIGPMSSREIRRQVRRLTASYPGHYGPSVSLREVPRRG